MRATKKVLPGMRSRKMGRVIAISSVGGLQGVPFSDIYCASKFAIEGMYESLGVLYKSFNVHAMLIGNSREIILIKSRTWSCEHLLRCKYFQRFCSHHER